MIYIINNQIEENNNFSDLGTFKTQITDSNNNPIPNATVSIFQSGNSTMPLEQITTNEQGITPTIDLKSPNIELSLDENNILQPYSTYNIEINADGFEKTDISGIQILSETLSISKVNMVSLNTTPFLPEYAIGPHTLYGDYPPKIAELEVKPINESGEIVLKKVVIPEFIIVHDGPPSDSSARDYTVRYTDYIKNVASSEIYPTWPESTLYANILAILSFTLNRVFTEWYAGKGYSFTITSSTAFDQKWIPERNIFDSISLAVDDVFTNYLSRPDVLQPLFTQYCDGKTVTCPKWLSQWGSKTLGEDGFSAIDILRSYYGNSIYINEANQVSGIPYSWEGANLSIGSSEESVLQLQELLNIISTAYPLIKPVVEDGIYGENTQNAVKTFQKIFNLPQTGIVDKKTWYKISQIYVGVTKIAENI